MPTRPAREAFRHMETSGLPLRTQVKTMQVKVATAGARVVLPRIWASWAASAAAAPLKPYQQNQRMKHPSAPMVRECPGMALTWMRPSFSRVYLPIRGPSIHAPIRAASPPTMWITEEPAKST